MRATSSGTWGVIAFEIASSVDLMVLSFGASAGTSSVRMYLNQSRGTWIKCAIQQQMQNCKDDKGRDGRWSVFECTVQREHGVVHIVVQHEFLDKLLHRWWFGVAPEEHYDVADKRTDMHSACWACINNQVPM